MTGAVLDAAIKIHRDFGPGMLESVYERVLAASLTRLDLAVQCQVPIDIHHDGMILQAAFRADLVVEGSVLVELKCADRTVPEFERQLLTYMRLAKFRTGLLINFGRPTLIEGFKRYVL